MTIAAGIPSPPVNGFTIGPVEVHYYALCILVGVVIASWATAARLRAAGISGGSVIDVAIWAVPIATPRRPHRSRAWKPVHRSLRRTRTLAIVFELVLVLGRRGNRDLAARPDQKCFHGGLPVFDESEDVDSVDLAAGTEDVGVFDDDVPETVDRQRRPSGVVDVLHAATQRRRG
ncbi:prolipoprotein diacylglyceryl transferase [Curtobacterium sp. VKM Ac-1395]|nr:prolipoprotein diacylglyceryl transferase [Curtobacterium sp. VKM Ac-1395]